MPHVVRSNPLAAALVLALAAAPWTLAPAPAAAQGLTEPDDAGRYSACMSLASSDPEEAFATANVWETEGGDDAARHCAAVALLGLGQYAEAGQRLEALADTLGAANAGLQPDILAQAGQAWLLAGDTARAFAVQSAAIELDPEDAELLVDRALTLATAQNYWEAIDDLNEAVNLAPNRADILIFRGSAYRYVDALELATDDINRGLELDPDNPEGLLERGILRRLQGDDQGARDDWLKVVTVAEGSPAAEAAQSNLETLDVKTE